MNNAKKIAVLTVSRADFSHLQGVISLLHADPAFRLQLVVTGTHLMASHGMTFKEIEAEGFPIAARIKYEMRSDRPEDVCLAMSALLKEASDFFAQEKPDGLLVLGDRYEVLPVVSAAVIHQIPVFHIHGGEATEGLIDDAVRHAVTKMSALHFVAAKPYQERVIQMGEQPSRVFNFGAPGLDNLKRIPLLGREALEKELNLQFQRYSILVTYHPVTLSEEKTKQELEALIAALEERLATGHTSVFITLPNADTYHSFVKDSLQKLIDRHPSVWGFSNLGYVRYLSLMKQVDLVLGNSSSGIIEAPFLNKAVVNVGIRQRGRAMSGHIISVAGERRALGQAIDQALNPDFQRMLSQIPSVYGDGKTCERIIDILKNLNFLDLRFKSFYDSEKK